MNDWPQILPSGLLPLHLLLDWYLGRLSLAKAWKPQNIVNNPVLQARSAAGARLWASTLIYFPGLMGMEMVKDFSLQNS